MKIGYMRVSSDNDRQNTDLQRDALLQAGVDPRHIFKDKASGAKDKRPGLQTALDFLKKGDCLVVWKLFCMQKFWIKALNPIRCFKSSININRMSGERRT